MVLGDLSKNVEVVIQSLSTIAKQKPATTTTPNIEGDDEERQGKIAASLKRNEKLRALINFDIPPDTLSDTSVKPSNLIQYLGLIEQKANELMTLSYIVANPRKVVLTGDQDSLIPAGGVSGLVGQGPQPAVGQLDIQPPGTG